MYHSTVEILILDGHPFRRLLLLLLLPLPVPLLLILLFLLLQRVLLFQQSFGNFEHNIGRLVLQDVLFSDFDFDVRHLGASGQASSSRTAFLDFLTGSNGSES